MREAAAAAAAAVDHLDKMERLKFGKYWKFLYGFEFGIRDRNGSRHSLEY
jgi:hypothetical protein